MSGLVDRRQPERRAAAVDRAAHQQGPRAALPSCQISRLIQRGSVCVLTVGGGDALGGHRARTERDDGVRHLAPLGDRRGHQLRAGADDEVGALAGARDRLEHARGVILQVAEHASGPIAASRPAPACRPRCRCRSTPRRTRTRGSSRESSTAPRRRSDVPARAQGHGERQHRLDVAAGSVRREQHTHVCILSQVDEVRVRRRSERTNPETTPL